MRCGFHALIINIYSKPIYAKQKTKKQNKDSLEWFIVLIKTTNDWKVKQEKPKEQYDCDKQIKHFTKLEENVFWCMKTTLTVIAKTTDLCNIYIYFDKTASGGFCQNIYIVLIQYCKRISSKVKPNLYNDINVGLSTYFYVIYEFKKYVKECVFFD